jgi:hypothetical protein
MVRGQHRVVILALTMEDFFGSGRDHMSHGPRFLKLTSEAKAKIREGQRPRHGTFAVWDKPTATFSCARLLCGASSAATCRRICWRLEWGAWSKNYRQEAHRQMGDSDINTLKRAASERQLAVAALQKKYAESESVSTEQLVLDMRELLATERVVLDAIITLFVKIGDVEAERTRPAP